MESKNFRCCDYCGRMVLRQWRGKRLKDGSKIYHDAAGQRWAGKRCADCEKKRVRTAIKFNRFDRMLVTRELEAEGYKIKKFANPMIVEADGQTYRIPIRKAYTDGRKITVEEPLNAEEAESFLLVFSSSRIFSREQIAKMSLAESLQTFH